MSEKASVKLLRIVVEMAETSLDYMCKLNLVKSL